ncbi:GNAT family N-acetyltransferase [Staphylococcus caeli]|uniref:Acetyltransferase n=1 Tax=Staphylococcus caeli TaxID=2201815 RepID=A0A1D4JK15_9STAP|nr:GNAT family N-acetyltransferase [Staphylococcus caeli]SCS43469.1 acetyltransferase [Staphylococcus caeli]SCS62129.1 acetyltransferase [Staphylococcus caeli]
MTIKRANDAELEIINDTIPQLFKESITTTCVLTDEAMRTMSQRLKAQGATYYVLVENGQFKGFMLLDQGEDILSQQVYGFIYELFVFKSFRRQGVAQNLIDFAKIFFKEQGVDEIRLNVFAENNAKLLYEKVGFHDSRIIMKMDLEK